MRPFAALSLSLLAAGISAHGHAQTYPSKAIRLFIGYGDGF